ncbi:MAG: methionine--tRNA ligase [Calditrichia bacterium]
MRREFTYTPKSNKKLSDKKRYMLTSALPYANGPIHLGHLAGAYLPGDIYARYCRLKKRDVVYICGSDEHGVAIQIRARKDGVTPREIIDRYHPLIKESFERVGMSFDYYGRTSAEIHHKTSQDFFRTVAENGHFQVKSEEQLFDPEANMFLADRFVIGTCPNCSFENAYGDQCENCGTALSPKELVNPRSTITDAKPELRTTTHWYLPLDKFQSELEKYIESHPEWRKNVLGQIGSWFKSGLQPRSITRDLSWGIQVPQDVADKEGVDASGKKLYVWFDAPIGYISATKEWAVQQGNPDAWEAYWKNKDTALVHFIGKDNIVFHCLTFPAILMAHGDYILPENVPANEFLNLEGNKFSTSRDYAVWLNDYLDRFDPDPLRYTLAIGMPESKDGDFSWKEFQSRHNNELADVLGNFVNRTFTFVKKYFEDGVPAAETHDDLDKELFGAIESAQQEMGQALDEFEFKKATKRLMELGRFANKYFNDREPWKTRKSAPEVCATSLNNCVQATRALAVLMSPFIPFSAEKIWQMLQLEGKAADAEWESVAERHIQPGHKIGELVILFQKLEDNVIDAEIERLNSALKTEPDTPVEESNLISFEDFQNIDLRTAKVIEAEAVPKANRLLRLQVDLGSEKRQIVAGLAENYQPEDLIGKTVVVVANLKPATIRGVESQGMLLAVKDESGLTIVSPEKDVAPGNSVA